LSAAAARRDASRSGGDGQKIRPLPGHFGFIASLTLHRSWKRREGFCRIFIRFECTHEDHSNGFIILIPAGFLGGRIRTRMISAASRFEVSRSSSPGRDVRKIRYKNSATRLYAVAGWCVPLSRNKNLTRITQNLILKSNRAVNATKMRHFFFLCASRRSRFVARKKKVGPSFRCTTLGLLFLRTSADTLYKPRSKPWRSG